MEQQINHREKYIDNAKAFAIILVVLGHIAVGLTKSSHDVFGILSYYIYCFHMPFFFILSGLSYQFVQNSIKRQNNNGYIKWTIKHCFDFGWVFVVFSALSFLIFPKDLLNAYSDNGVMGILMKCAKNYWYILVLCLIYVFALWIRNINLFFLILILAASLLCGFINMGIAKFLLYFFFFELGVYLDENCFIKLNKNRKIYGIAFFILSTIWYFLSGGGVVK